jgi:membrane protease YdiL (CAAX protease family)
MNVKTKLSIELFLLFIAVPLSLLLPYSFKIKGVTVLLAFIYLLYILFAKTDIKFNLKKGIDWKSFIKTTAIKFAVVMMVTTTYVYLVDPAKLFCVPRTDMRMFVIILALYTFLSVWPQELIYRTFFFARYAQFFTNNKLLIFVNAIIFSLAHLFFQNTLVTVLTFIGGLLFAYTFSKTKSTTLVSIEHAIYGNWLFTVGMGEMLAFPGMGAC